MILFWPNLDKYPDILWNILKVIERPCDYIGKLDNVSKKVQALNLPADEFTNELVTAGLDYYKHLLGCDGKREHWWLARGVYYT
jgi:hypothetical protein